VSEQATEVVDGVTRFVISPALLNAFLKHRLTEGRSGEVR